MVVRSQRVAFTQTKRFIERYHKSPQQLVLFLMDMFFSFFVDFFNTSLCLLHHFFYYQACRGKCTCCGINTLGHLESLCVIQKLLPHTGKTYTVLEIQVTKTQLNFEDYIVNLPQMGLQNQIQASYVPLFSNS